MCSAIAIYVLVSLLGPQQVTDMNRLLNRTADAPLKPGSRKETWLARLGVDSEFSPGDRSVAYVSIAWPVAWTTVFLSVTVWSLIVDVPESWWAGFWRVWIWVFTSGAFVVTTWFIVGGYRDLKIMFKHLREFTPDPNDDGQLSQPRSTE